MRQKDIKYITVHCTATLPNAKVENILQYWKSIGWKRPGYHVLIDAEGKIHQLLRVDSSADIAIANSVKGFNTQQVAVSYIGGIDAAGKPKDTRTPAQKAALLQVLQSWRKMFPTAKIVAHHDLNPGKACPSFPAQKEYAHI